MFLGAKKHFQLSSISCPVDNLVILILPLLSWLLLCTKMALFRLTHYWVLSRTGNGSRACHQWYFISTILIFLYCQSMLSEAIRKQHHRKWQYQEKYPVSWFFRFLHRISNMKENSFFRTAKIDKMTRETLIVTSFCLKQEYVHLLVSLFVSPTKSAYVLKESKKKGNVISASYQKKMSTIPLCHLGNPYTVHLSSRAAQKEKLYSFLPSVGSHIYYSHCAAGQIV